MSHRNFQTMRHMIDPEADQGPGQRLPDPYIFYSSVPNLPQPKLQSAIPSLGSHCNFNVHPNTEHHNNAVFYSMTPHSVAQCSHYNPYLAPPSGTRDFPVQVNHGALDQFSLSTTHRIVGNPTDRYCRNMPCMDGIRGAFKIKNFEGAPSYQHQNAAAVPNSSGPHVTARPAVSDITHANAVGYVPLDPPFVEHRSLANMRNRAGVQSVQAHSSNHVIQGNYITPPAQLPGNPWLDSGFGANNGDFGIFAWPLSNLPYGLASSNVDHVEAGVGYQIRATDRGRASFMHPPYTQGHPNHHHPIQPLQMPSVNRPPQVTSSRRNLTNSSSNIGGRNPPVPPTGFRLYQPHRREIVLGSNIRHHNLPHLRVLPEDEVAILEISGYHEVGDTVDHHRDLRLDIDQMSYEELLSLGEKIGCVDTGLSEELIQKNLKVRMLTLSPAQINLEATNDQQRINFCVVCQTDYKSEEKIGTLECGHEYHSECIKKWLLMKNTCPVCKSLALRVAGKV